MNSLVHDMLSPSKIVCVGRNYSEHAKEMGNDVPKEPLLFLKPPSSIISDGEAIVLPPQSSHVEYEGEIGLVIGARLRDASEEEAAQAVRGIVALIDVSARDLQKSEPQWTRAKGFDTFCPVGNEVPAPATFDAITVVTRLNGEERQRGSSAQMVFGIPALLAYISTVMTLEPGDLVATGTPAGVAPIRPGDVVEVEVAGASRVRCGVVAKGQRAS
jgi:2-keto-4-pentenoate hydratase/2-oxohepta-3-ene-1,7-dioic acid hydratase in catechol pathway